MNYIVYYLFILPIAYLPYFFLYRVSTILCFVLKRIVGYRKKTVIKNLKNSFPKKSYVEIEIILNDFYRHLTDLFIESFKGFVISRKSILKRLVVVNQEVLSKYENQNIILIGAHYNNWEICGQCLPLYFNHHLLAIYKPLKNKFFNHKMKQSREKFGLEMIPMNKTKEYFNDQSNNPKGIIFGSDQSPSNPDKAYWMNFLNQETGVLFGAEKYAKEFNWPVVYVRINKVKRGYYIVEYEVITDQPQYCKHGEITEKFMYLVENDIKIKPQYWLWTHNRWKHQRPIENI